MALRGDAEPPDRHRRAWHASRFSVCRMLTEMCAASLAAAAAIVALAVGSGGNAPKPAIVPDFAAATCDGIELKIVTESSQPEYSLATVVTPRAPGGRLARAGDRIGDSTLVAVGYNGARMSPEI